MSILYMYTFVCVCTYIYIYIYIHYTHSLALSYARYLLVQCCVKRSRALVQLSAGQTDL